MPSTVIASMEYLPATAALRVTFTSGKVYDYLQVPYEVYQAIKMSRIKGIYFNQHIKNKYACQPVHIPGNDLFNQE